MHLKPKRELEVLCSGVHRIYMGPEIIVYITEFKLHEIKNYCIANTFQKTLLATENLIDITLGMAKFAGQRIASGRATEIESTEGMQKLWLQRELV